MQVAGLANALWRLQARYEEARQQQPLISTIKGGPPKMKQTKEIKRWPFSLSLFSQQPSHCHNQIWRDRHDQTSY